MEALSFTNIVAQNCVADILTLYLDGAENLTPPY